MNLKSIVNIIIGVFVGLLIAGGLFLTARAPTGKPVELLPSPTPQPIVVYVTGAVQRAGVYRLPPDSRLVDAVQAAGGFVDGADLNQVNLAELIKDGDQIVIPGLTTLPTPELTIGDNGLMVTPTPLPGGPININTASADEMAACHCGLGPSLAQKVVDYREQNGPFHTLDDLQKVPGIGPTIMDEIKSAGRFFVGP